MLQALFFPLPGYPLPIRLLSIGDRGAIRMSSEEWRPVFGFEGLYEVSSRGRVRSLGRTVRFRRHGHWEERKKPERMLIPDRDKDGYLRATLTDSEGQARHFGIHKLVAMAFVPLPEVAHIDHVRSNNVPSNLKWATRAVNHQDSVIENRYAE